MAGNITAARRAALQDTAVTTHSLPARRIAMTAFSSLMRRAGTLRQFESDPIRSEWWVGYMRGLRRAHHGANFGTRAEHEMWIAASESTDPMRASLGRGYVVGLTMECRDPP